jgi:hypothetical protein
MKQVKPSVLLALMLCVLIGYFEPANAAKFSKSVVMKAPVATIAYTALNSTTTVCPFWPNPIAPTSSLTAISYEVIVSASIQSTGSGPYAVSILAYDQPFPLGVVENNAYFEPALWPHLTGTTLGLPALADGNYVLTVKTSNGKAYTTKLSISSK